MPSIWHLISFMTNYIIRQWMISLQRCRELCIFILWFTERLELLCRSRLQCDWYG